MSIMDCQKVIILLLSALRWASGTSLQKFQSGVLDIGQSLNQDYLIEQRILVADATTTMMLCAQLCMKKEAACSAYEGSDEEEGGGVRCKTYRRAEEVEDPMVSWDILTLAF